MAISINKHGVGRSGHAFRNLLAAKRLRASASIAATLVLSAVSSWTYAQESSLAPGANVLEEVVVTSRKHEENLQDTPIAITVLGGEEMKARGADDLTSVNSIAPNVTFKSAGGTSGASFTPALSIRGIGQSDFTINTDPGVGVYLDGVYLGRSVGSVLDLAEVQRIEVLRGPQGTLFGRNTIGGAVSVISKVPEMDNFFGGVSASYGERDYQSLQGSVNIPLTDTIAARVSAIYRHRDGYVDALQYNDYQLGGEKMWGGRAAIRFQPTSDFTIDFAVDHSERRDPSSATVALQLGNLSSTSSAPTGTDSAFFNSGSGPAQTARVPYISVDAPRCATDAVFRNQSLTCYGNAWLAGTGGSNSVWTDRYGNKIIPTNTLNVTGYALTAALDTAIGTVKSITSYRKFESTFYGDLDFTPYVVFANNNVPYNQHQTSQELQLVGDRLWNGRVNYVVGLYYFNETGKEFVDLIVPGEIPAPLAPALASGLPYFQTTQRYIDNTSKAAYSQATVAITPQLKLTAGLRYSQERKDYLVGLSRIAGAPSSGAGVQSKNAWTPMVNLAWYPTDALMIYTTYSEGYRTGGFAARFLGGLPNPLPSFEPESVKSYEVGVKSSLFDKRVIVNAAVFKTFYDDIQVSATTPNLPGFTLNLASAEFTGFEVETQAILGAGFGTTVSVGYIDQKLTEVVPGTQSGAGTNAVVNITTQSELPGPQWQINAGLTHQFHFASGAKLQSRIDAHYESEDSNSVANYPIIVQGGHTEVNARVGYTFPSDRWELAIGARNLFNKEYFTSKTLLTAPGSAYGTVARPREAYMQVTTKFGQ